VAAHAPIRGSVRGTWAGAAAARAWVDWSLARDSGVKLAVKVLIWPPLDDHVGYGLDGSDAKHSEAELPSS
jgi:hypothetical protein